MRDLPQIEPMVLSLIPEAFDHPEWIFELKHDGFRAVAYVADGVCQLVSRRRNEYRSFKQLQTELARTLKVENAILDGEIVCLDQAGRSMFNELLFRRGHPVFYVFDLLWLNGSDFRQKPLHVRKAALQALVRRSRCEQVFFAQHIKEQGVSLFQLACKQDTEGSSRNERMESMPPASGGSRSRIATTRRLSGATSYSIHSGTRRSIAGNPRERLNRESAG